MVELGTRVVKNFFEDRMTTYAEQLSYRGLFGLFPFIILVFTLLALLRVDAVFDQLDRKSTRLNSSHANISYAVFCLKKKKKTTDATNLSTTASRTVCI